MRRAARIGRHGPRGRAFGRLHRIARSDRIARWRQVALPRQGRAERGREHQHRDLGIDHGPGSDRTGLPRPHPDRTRRHREQIAPGRERDARGLDGGRQGSSRRNRLALVSLFRRLGRYGDAGADDERHQWRRPRRQQPRSAGIHDPAGRRPDFPRSHPLRRDGVPHPQEAVARPWPQHCGGRRRRLRTQPQEP